MGAGAVMNGIFFRVGKQESKINLVRIHNQEEIEGKSLPELNKQQIKRLSEKHIEMLDYPPEMFQENLRCIVISKIIRNLAEKRLLIGENLSFFEDMIDSIQNKIETKLVQYVKIFNRAKSRVSRIVNYIKLLTIHFIVFKLCLLNFIKPTKYQILFLEETKSSILFLKEFFENISSGYEITPHKSWARNMSEILFCGQPILTDSDKYTKIMTSKKTIMQHSWGLVDIWIKKNRNDTLLKYLENEKSSQYIKTVLYKILIQKNYELFQEHLREHNSSHKKKDKKEKDKKM